MRVALDIFLHDLKKLLRNPCALAIIIGIIALSSACAWCSIAAMWNPYAHTDELNVVVVNNDKGVKLGDVQGVKLTNKSAGNTEIDIGSMLVDAMEQDENFNWQFVDEDQGKAGVESGEYYAALVLPETLSEDFLSVLAGYPANPTIEYWVNEKHHAVALESTDTGAGVVDAVISRVFSTLVANAMTGIVKDVVSNLLDAGVQVHSQAYVRLEGATSDLENVESGFSAIATSISTWHTTVDDARKTIDDLKDDVPSLKESIDDAEQLLANARTGAHIVTSAYASALAEGGPELSSLLEQVSKRVKDVASAIESKQPALDAAMQKAEKALDACDRLIGELAKEDPESETIAALEKQSETLRAQLEAFGKAGAAIDEAAAKASESSEKVASEVDGAVRKLQAQSDEFNREILPLLDTSLDALALVMGSLDSALSALDAQTAQAADMLDQLDRVLDQVKTVLESTTDSLDEVAESLAAAQSDLALLSRSQTVERLSTLVSVDAKSYGTVMDSPVRAQTTAMYPLGSYGAGVAPFFTNLAIWMCCLMLIVVIKLEIDPELFPDSKPWQGYVGRLMLLTLLAVLQGAIVTIGDLALGIEAVGPVSLIVAGLITAFCFASIVYALAVTFKHVGKILALMFLIVQIPGASNMFPSELMPTLLQGLRPFMPFTYGMGAMSEAIGGFYGTAFLANLTWLLACGLGSLAVALIVRPAMLNLNLLFDWRLTSADLFLTEGRERATSPASAAERPATNALLEPAGTQSPLRNRADTLERRYTTMKQVAPLAVIALLSALVLLSYVLNLDADGKLAALTASVALIAIVFGVCLAFEYANENMPAPAPTSAGMSANAEGAEPLFVDALWENDVEGWASDGDETLNDWAFIEPDDPDGEDGNGEPEAVEDEPIEISVADGQDDDELRDAPSPHSPDDEGFQDGKTDPHVEPQESPIAHREEGADA